MGENKFLLPPQGCICPGSNLTFECAIEGGGTTVWSGSFITNCQSVGTEISLRHSDQFTQGYETCNNGAVTVIPLSVMINNNTTSYTSQLHINMTMISLLNGSTVTCAHDQYDGNDKTIVGSWTMIGMHAYHISEFHFNVSRSITNMGWGLAYTINNLFLLYSQSLAPP